MHAKILPPMLACPSDVLKALLRSPVVVQMRDGETQEGRLLGFDEYFNLLIDRESESVFIRGECVVLVGAPV